jgi:hypothetical protein
LKEVISKQSKKLRLEKKKSWVGQDEKTAGPSLPLLDLLGRFFFLGLCFILSL